MIMTYDWIIHAERNPDFKEQIKSAMEADAVTELKCMEMFHLTFSSQEGYVTVRSLSDTSPFHYKIVNTRISYKAVLQMMEGDWEHLEQDDIQVIK